MKLLYILLGILLSILFYYNILQRNNIIINEHKCSFSNKKHCFTFNSK